MNYDILVTEDVEEFMDNLDDKSERICRDNLRKLENNPFPGSGRGDKEKLQNSNYYRLHIGRTYTAIYLITENESKVEIRDLLTI